MKNRTWAVFLVAGAVLASVSGCGANSNTAAPSGSAPMGQTTNGQGQRGHFQPTITMTTNPSSVAAGKPFSLTFSMQRPHTGANGQYNGSHNGTGQGAQNSGNWTGNGGQRGGNWTGSQGGNGGNPPQMNATVVITGNGVNQTIQLTDQNRTFEGTATIQKAGTYQVAFSMNMGPRQIQMQFTLQVK